MPSHRRLKRNRDRLRDRGPDRRARGIVLDVGSIVRGFAGLQRLCLICDRPATIRQLIRADTALAATLGKPGNPVFVGFRVCTPCARKPELESRCRAAIVRGAHFTLANPEAN